MQILLPSLVSLLRYGGLKSLQNAESAFFKNFRVPCLQKDAGNDNNICIFGPVFYLLSDGGIYFSI